MATVIDATAAEAAGRLPSWYPGDAVT